MKNREDLEVTAQVRFGENGEMEADNEVDTDLTDWGVVDEEQERETKIEEEAASEFGVDDRSEKGSIEAGVQGQLFISRDEEQMTLGGETGGMESKYD